MSTQLASVDDPTEIDEPEQDQHGFEKFMTVAEFAKAEGMSLKTAYEGFKRKGWPYRGDLGPMKVSREDRIQIRKMCRRVNEPAAEAPEMPKQRRAGSTRRPPAQRRSRKPEAA